MAVGHCQENVPILVAKLTTLKRVIYWNAPAIRVNSIPRQVQYLKALPRDHSIFIRLKNETVFHSMLSLCKKGADVFHEIKWGAWALIALYFSIGSGVIVGLQYDYITPYYSSSSLDIVIPFGYYFRSLHFYTSQFFFFFTCFHLIAVFSKTDRYEKKEWLKLVTTIPVIILLLFTGYILRGDSTGSSAGFIADNIVRTIPFFSYLIDSVLLSLESSGLRKVYVQHVVGLDIVLFILLWRHLRVYRVRVLDHLYICIAMLLFFRWSVCAHGS